MKALLCWLAIFLTATIVEIWMIILYPTFGLKPGPTLMLLATFGIDGLIAVMIIKSLNDRDVLPDFAQNGSHAFERVFNEDLKDHWYVAGYICNESRRVSEMVGFRIPKGIPIFGLVEYQGTFYLYDVREKSKKRISGYPLSAAQLTKEYIPNT